MTKRLIDIAFDELRSMVGSLASIAAEAVREARKCLESCAPTDLESMRRYARDAYRLRIEILDLATEINARFQPVAADLRLLQALMSASYDFYRITRYALEIARTLLTIECTGCEMKLACEAWGHVEEMMGLARKAILELDEEAAKKIMKLDASVDEAYVAGLSRMKGREYIPRCDVAEAMVLRHLERIADHLTYIASETVYAVKGVREFV
jgi:phosphate transport system protein